MENELVERITSSATAWDAAAICGVQLPMRAGSKFKVPWREDRKPSATLTADGMRVIDWSTDESEDAAGMVGRMMGVSFPMAVNLLGSRLGMGEPFPDAPGMGRSRLILPGFADFAEPAEPEPVAAIEVAGIANFTTVSDAAADKWIRSVCEHLASDLELAVEISDWRGLPVPVVLRLAREGRLGSDGRNLWMPCKQEGGLWVRAQVRRIGPRVEGCEYFWPRESNHKPGLWIAAEGGGRVAVAEGWGDAAAALAILEGEAVTIVATLGIGARKLEAMTAEAALILRQNDRGDANERWARGIRALWPSISVKSLMPPAGVKDWNDALKAHGPVTSRVLMAAAMTVADDPPALHGPAMASRRYNELNESMASEVFIELAEGDLLHDNTLTKGEWYSWEGTHWQPGAEKQAQERAKDVQVVLKLEARAESRQRPARADGQEDQRRRAPNELMEAFAAGCGQMRVITNMLSLAASDARMAGNFAKVQPDPFHLPCLNGIFDLRWGSEGFRPARREDMITRRIGVAFDEDAACPRWLQFVTGICQGDAGLMGLIQRWFGYSLTGSVAEQKLLFLYGTGSNGKSTMAEVLLALMGELAINVPQTMVVLDKHGNLPPDIEMIRLRGTRVALAPEIDKNARLSESTIKTLTGGDRLRGRDHYAKSTDFPATFKLLFYGNHKPMAVGGDDGLWRRFLMLHLRAKFEGAAKDPYLKDKLMTELPGILNWAIAGCWEWQRQGLNPPQSVLDELTEYRASSDSLGAFLGEHIQPLQGLVLRIKDIRTRLVEWAKDNGEGWLAEHMSVRKLRREMEERGWEVKVDRKECPYIAGAWKDSDQLIGKDEQ